MKNDCIRTPQTLLSKEPFSKGPFIRYKGPFIRDIRVPFIRYKGPFIRYKGHTRVLLSDTRVLLSDIRVFYQIFSSLKRLLFSLMVLFHCNIAFILIKSWLYT